LTASRSLICSPTSSQLLPSGESDQTLQHQPGRGRHERHQS
jgi:hypothetical protein